MKKVFFSSLLALATIVCFQSSYAQFSKGDKKVNLGVGLGSLGANASVEYGIMDDLGVGLFASYERPSTGLIGALTGVRYSYNEISVGPRAAYHLNRVLNMKDDKFDLYVAGGVLYRHVTYPYDYSSISNLKSSYGYISLLARVGAGFQFSDNLAGFAELGSGGSWVQAGISFKF
jgi:opacity protein-like surface antigen